MVPTYIGNTKYLLIIDHYLCSMDNGPDDVYDDVSGGPPPLPPSSAGPPPSFKPPSIPEGPPTFKPPPVPPAARAPSPFNPSDGPNETYEPFEEPGGPTEEYEAFENDPAELEDYENPDKATGFRQLQQLSLIHI